MDMTNEQILQECVARGLLTNKQMNRILHKDDFEVQLQQEADLWIAFNSEMFTFMEQAAIDFQKKDHKFSSRLLSETARWLYEGESQRIGKFKIKDCLAKYVTKRIVERHPELTGFVKFNRKKENGPNV